MQRHASGGSSPRSSMSVETAVAAVVPPATPAHHLPPLRMQPPAPQHMGAAAGPAGNSSDGYPGTAPSSIPGSPVTTGSSYSSSRSSTSSRAGSPTYRSSNTSMARTQSIRCMEAADMLRR